MKFSGPRRWAARSRGWRAYAEPERLAQERVTDTDQFLFRHNLGTALAVLGTVSRGLGELDQARRHLIDAVAATMPPEVVEAARERGRARDLEETVGELLAELGE